MNIEKMVTEYIKLVGCDGLVNSDYEGCACELEGLMPCGELCEECEAGKKKYCKDCDKTQDCASHKDGATWCMWRAQAADIKKAGEKRAKMKDMTEADIKYMLNRIANHIRTETDALFLLVVFDDPGVAQYISNAKREDCIKAMEKTANRFRNNKTIERI